MQKITLIIILLFAFATQAQSPAKQDNLEKLFEVMDTNSMMDTMWSQMRSMIMNIQEQESMTAEELAIVDKYTKQFTAIMKEEMSWNAMKEDLRQVYRQNYTEQEIGDMLAFYQSSTGQKMLLIMPVLMQESLKIGQSLAEAAMPKLMQNRQQMNEELAELKK
jgi:hypothetical protein